MLPNVSQLLTKAKTFPLNKHLTCANFGIYIVTCVICHEQYVGQTSNKFSKNGQRIAVIGRDKIVKPRVTRTRWPCRKPSSHSLDIYENKWYHLFDAQTNIQSMMIPHEK